MLLLAACKAPPDATVEFSDAAREAFVMFDAEDEADLASPVEKLLERIAEETDLSATSAGDRALTPEVLQESDIAEIPNHPDRDPSLVLPIAVAWSSPYPSKEHARVLLLSDQTEVEYGADAYTRTFPSGSDCFPDGCALLETDNHATKSNIITGPLTFDLVKNYREITLSTGDAAIVSRSWVPEAAVSDDGETTVQQSYGMEFFADQGSGVTRLLVLWAETTFSTDISDDVVAATTQLGINEGFKKYDAWIEANPD